MRRTLVSYSYYEGSDPRYAENLRFFLNEGLKSLNQHKHVDYIFVVQGRNCSVQLPEHTQVRVLLTDNSGFDFGAHYKGQVYLQQQGVDLTQYDTLIFMNSGQRGPFLPSYWDDAHHWSEIFERRLAKHQRPGIVGSSMFCHKDTKQPIVETWCFALSQDAFQDVRENTSVFTVHATKYRAVIDGEDRLTPYLYDRGYDVDSLLFKYRDMDWSKGCDNCVIPSRPWSYEDITVHPFEVVFYKTYWRSSANEDENGYVCPFEQRYTEWALKKNPASVLKLRPSSYNIEDGKARKSRWRQHIKNPLLIATVALSTVTLVLIIWLVLLYSPSVF